MDTSGRRAKAEGHGDASASGQVGSQSALDGCAGQTPHVHFSLRSLFLIGASQNLPSKSLLRKHGGFHFQVCSVLRRESSHTSACVLWRVRYNTVGEVVRPHLRLNTVLGHLNASHTIVCDQNCRFANLADLTR